MTIEEAIKLVRLQYENDLESAYIVNPVAHALYEAWKKADEATSWAIRESPLQERISVPNDLQEFDGAVQAAEADLDVRGSGGGPVGF